MSAPVKPWETVPSITTDALPSPPAAGGGASVGAAPPPPPPRPVDSGYNSSYSSMSTGMYGSGLGMYGGGIGGYGGMYGSPMMRYGGYGGYGGYGVGQGSEVARIAEEGTRSAFQSVEALVQAFSSISIMLESTYFALHSSFRAVIGVADHFSRVKDQLTQILATLSIVRTLRWIVYKTLYMIGLAKENPDRAWNAAQAISANGIDAMSLENNGPNRSSWPVMMFFSVVVAAPWLIYRMFASSGVQSSAKWSSGEAAHYVAVAQYDFAAETDRELSLKAGTYIRIAPKNLQPPVRGWLLGSIDGQRTGLVPANYLKILGSSDAQGVIQTQPNVTTTVSTEPSTSSTVSISTQSQPAPIHVENDVMATSTNSLYNEFVQVSMDEMEDTKSKTEL